MYTSPLVFAGGSQRCQGLHIKAPGVILYDETTMTFAAGHEHHWGRGYFYEQDAFVGGIFFASNLDDNSVVYTMLLWINPFQALRMMNHGGCESLRSMVGSGAKL